MTTTKAIFLEEIKLVEKILNEIEALCLNPEFIKASIETCKKVGITAKEWNENKTPILMKFASQIVFEKL